MDRPRDEGNNEDNRGPSGWGILAGIAGVAALAGGVYYLSRDKNPQASQHRPLEARNVDRGGSSTRYIHPDNESSDSESDNGVSHFQSGRVETVPANPIVTNLESLLSAIYVKYVSIKVEEFNRHYGVLMDIFNHLHRTMKTVDRYYNRYASTVSFAGSHFDGARIEKPDEFDLDIVIRMPVNYSWTGDDSDVNFHPQDAGFLQLRMGSQFRNLPNRDGADWVINQTAYKWKDEYDYLCRSKFIDWFKSVVVRALNQYGMNERGIPVREIGGRFYTIRRSESGPAITMIIENEATGFKMDFDLVPALRFPETRWPVSEEYRAIPPRLSKDYWLVVPKPNLREPSDAAGVARSWRCSLQNQERELIHDRHNLKQALRLMKKLRDAQGMKKISSYYIKTLFYWEVVARDDDVFFWRRSLANLFIIMVDRLYDAVDKGEIPYFWNKHNNLIDNVKRTVLEVYKKQLADLKAVLASPSEYRSVARFLLTPTELDDFNESIKGKALTLDHICDADVCPVYCGEI